MDKNQELTMYIRNLLVETLPKSQRSQEVLEKLNIDTKDRFITLQLLLSRSMKNSIHSKREEDITDWKSDFHKVLIEELSDNYIQVVSLLNLQPIIRTIVIKISDKVEEDKVKIRLEEAFYRLNSKLEKLYSTGIVGCYGIVVDDFFQLGKAYKRARELQEYHYIIGRGKCAFFDILSNTEEVSLVEYKYIHFFDDLIHKEEWISLIELLNTIKTSLRENYINDSKTMYIYKEIFSITIRYLFREPEKYSDEIDKLNSGIIKFEHLFDDIDDIHEYFMKVFSHISESDPYEHVNPHIRKALSIIHLEYAQAISLSEIADDLSLSIEYLSRLFKNEMNCNFKKYLTRLRLDKAKELLRTTKKDINEIRVEVGYQSATQFVRAFKANEGLTPSRYRKYVRVNKL